MSFYTSLTGLNAATAQLGGHVHAVQTKGLGFVMDSLGFGVVQKARFFDFVFNF